MTQRLLSTFGRNDRIHILGKSASMEERIGIISFNVLYGNVNSEGCGLYLHYNFVCALLNDLFGVQARGGCACAGTCICM